MELNPHCRRCPLWETRNLVVPPDGDRSSPVCLVGEAPGEKEDLEGRPFVGKAGKVLDRFLEEGGVPRNGIMITNTVKCRPPGNRIPTVVERKACFPYLEQELRGKELVVGLGRVASSNLLGKEIMLEKEANVSREMAIGGLTLEFLPTYHPAACLFNLKARAGLRETIKVIGERYFPSED